MIGKDLWRRMKGCGAVWEHSGDPRAPHVALRGDKHSDGFIDTLRFLSDTDNRANAAELLITRLNSKYFEDIDWVFGSPMAGIPFATTLAGCFNHNVNLGFTEKVNEKDLICRFEIEPGQSVLMVEEMTTTGATPQRAIDAILKKNPEAQILDTVVAFLVRCEDRPPELAGRELLSLISLPHLGVNYHEWEPNNCPLCQQGSRVIKNCKRVWGDLLKTMKDSAHHIPD
ncbi:MAG: hypothetical protein AAB453_01230 [Patescibacteria group bacterium]